MNYQPTPVQELRHAALDKAGIRLLVKREDLNHAHISGNKWWKLKYNLWQARLEKQNVLLTFGGAWSNHIHATSAAAREEGFSSIGIIRGEKILPLNRNLSFARSQGMDLHFVSRETYRSKTEASFVEKLHQELGDFYLIPEGGTNGAAVKGCAEFAERELLPVDHDHLFLAAGTGGTMAGIIAGFKGSKRITGVSVLRNGDFLRDKISALAFDHAGAHYGNWSLLTSYHHRGYAKVTKELLGFVAAMKEQHNLPLDPVYTGKMMWAVMHEIESGMFARGDTILALHTGGLQTL